MTDFAHLSQRLFNVPLAITPHKAEVVMAALADRLGVAQLFRADGQLVQLAGFDLEDDAPARDRPYEVVAGVAVIPITGTLVNKLGSMRPYSGMTGYDGIRANLSIALADESVRAIAFDIESPGGEVSGCFDLVDDIFSARGDKPIWSILSESAYSAAYAIASATDRIVVPRTGGTGSIGVIAMHVDFSKALAKDGITVTVLRSDEFKAETNEFEPLTDGAYGRLMAEIAEMRDLFVDTVARNRGLAASKVGATKAATFMGSHGVSAGLADAVMAPSEAFRALVSSLG